MLCSKSETPVDKFWSWFLTNRKDIESKFQSDPPKAVDAITAAFRQATPDLMFEVSPKTDPREFTVSADGIIERFPSVLAFVNAAPKIPGWKVVAFRQADPRSFGVNHKGISLDRASVFVEPLRDKEGFLNLILYVPNLSAMDRKAMEATSFILLDSCIGEYDAVKRIRYVDYRDISEKTKDSFPIGDLVTFISTHKQEIPEYR